MPDVALGHSSGEIAAAYASGAISAEAAMATATFRGSSNVSTDQKGSVAATGLGQRDVSSYLVPGVAMACHKSQSSTTISGDTDAVNEVVQRLKAEQPGVLARLLRVDNTYHSHHMLQYGQSYEEQIMPYVCSRDPLVAQHSSVTWALTSGSRVSREWRFRKHPPHELLGNRIVETAANEPVWRNSLALEDVPWLAGHEVNGQIVLPAAGYIAMVGEALLQLHEVVHESHETTFSIKNLHIASARILKMNSTVELITSLKPIMIDASETTTWYQFAISSFDGTR
ncbi:Highly reducing polyketide synthase gloL [Metarhizium brunneum]|uniref:Highly reducing polyketide synthase gloL n=1 Tax=Metarhizium brunneum TaxID=500148 RepID=A0A7D5V6X0_9HYPO|nr:Highly reducing polyketide synthase gloL [Metarhizium brunneum]